MARLAQAAEICNVVSSTPRQRNNVVDLFRWNKTERAVRIAPQLRRSNLSPSAAVTAFARRHARLASHPVPVASTGADYLGAPIIGTQPHEGTLAHSVAFPRLTRRGACLRAVSLRRLDMIERSPGGVLLPMSHDLTSLVGRPIHLAMALWVYPCPRASCNARCRRVWVPPLWPHSPQRHDCTPSTMP